MSDLHQPAISTGSDSGFPAGDLARRLSDPQLRYDDALVDLSTTFEGGDPVQLREILDEGARSMFGAAALDLQVQAAVLADVLYDRLALGVELGDHRSVLLGYALSRRRAHPLLLAVLAHEFARRAGLQSAVATAGGDYWTILARGQHFLPIGYVQPPDDEAVTRLQVFCPHAVACKVLETIGDHAPDAVASIAVQVRSLLPLTPHAQHTEQGYPDAEC